MSSETTLRGGIREVQDYPRKGVVFKDITPLMKDQRLFKLCIEELAAKLSGKKIDYIIGIEARGFIIGSALSYLLQKGFVPIRKNGKLPGATIKREYQLEYGSATIEMQENSIESGSSVVIVDDVLATGGTARAAADLAESLGANVVSFAFLAELSFLNGREKLSDYDIIALVRY